MDIQEQIVSSLSRMNESINTNHLEVCQRLTALEVTQIPHKDLEKRVAKLEGWRNFVVGMAVTVGFLLKTATGYLINRH